MPQGPEQTARTQIDRLLQVAGWAVQGVSAVDLYGARGVAVREFPLTGGNDPRPHRRKSGHRADHFEYAPFPQHGGLGKVDQLFGQDPAPIIEALNTALIT